MSTTDKIESRQRSVLELSAAEAKTFFLKAESYCNLELPRYIKFDPLLSNVSNILDGKRLSDFRESNPRDRDDLNYVIVNNKDGKYAWRPIKLVHPALYVSLTHTVTEGNYWSDICNRFQDYSFNPNIRCLSLPVESLTDEQDKAEQILGWWWDVEQQSIELALDFEYLIQTDVTNCYGAIYTHSIPWALHTKPVAKENRSDKGLIGNLLDWHLQDMSHGQTNGIPQGSVLMDFIAEMVLGYADRELTEKLVSLSIKDFKILRYRDDYRIFVNNPQHGEAILKALTEVLFDLGLKINSSKTFLSRNVIQGAIKPDKLHWMTHIKSARNLQQHLLIIHDHAMHFPNSGSLSKALTNFHKRLSKRTKVVEPIMPMISIVVDIAYHSPRTYHVVSAILSKLITMLEDEESKIDVISRLQRRFAKLPNTGHMQIWLQRIALPIDRSIPFEEPICELVYGEEQSIWPTDWLRGKLSSAIAATLIVDQDIIDSLQPIIPPEEVELFMSRDRYW